MAPILESGKVVAKRYEVIKQLDHYKELFICKDNCNSGEQLILKVEIITTETKTSRLMTEWLLYKKLSTTNCFNFVVNFLTDKEFHYLLMKPLGNNLYEFYKQKTTQNEWSLETVVRFADEMISRVANCHMRGIIHRDIKPENFVVDQKDNNYLYLIDFNLAKEFSTPSVPHIPYHIHSPKHTVGNVQFLSINAHKGIEQSRRDDLISVCYSLIYLAKGSLPWSNFRSRDYSSRLEYLRAVGSKKLNCSVDELCDGLPVQFKQLMNYCSELNFEQNPDYFELRQLFSHLLKQIKASKVTLVRYQPKKDLKTIPNKPFQIKSRQSLSEQFKRCLESSPPMTCR